MALGPNGAVRALVPDRAPGGRWRGRGGARAAAGGCAGEVALGCGPAGAAAVAAGRLGRSRRGRRAVNEGDGARDRGGQR